jgi:conjugal transfer pilus assembly protein TraV
MIKGGKKFFVFFLVILGLSLNGCVGELSLSKLMNPYDDKFECPQFEKGKCVSIGQAYRESLQGGKQDILFTPTPTSQANSQKENGTSFSVQSVFPQDNSEVVYSKYNEALMKKLQEMLEAPKTPVLVPPQVVRVLILPYAADRDTFYVERYAYVIIEGPQWVFHNILNKEELK